MSPWQTRCERWSADPLPLSAPAAWTWDHSSHGHKGVLIQSGQLVWYRDSANPHLSEGGTQSLTDFMAAGPMSPLPEPMLRELFGAVRAALSARGQTAPRL